MRSGRLRAGPASSTGASSAIEGRFGNVHRTVRTSASELFINPLMTLAWMFDFAAVARRNRYLDQLSETESVWDIQRVIEAYRHTVRGRPRLAIPH